LLGDLESFINGLDSFILHHTISIDEGRETEESSTEFNKIIEHNSGRIVDCLVFYDFFARGNTPLYSLEELSHLIEDFTEQLSIHREFLIKTGHSPFYHSGHQFLEKLSSNYYTRLPKSVEIVNKPDIYRKSESILDYSDDLFWDVRSAFKVDTIPNLSMNGRRRIT